MTDVARKSSLEAPEGLSLALAVVVTAASVAAIAVPSVYDEEALAWKVQVVVQDWMDLLVLVPLLAASAVLSARGSRAARFVLGGALMYCSYNMAIYAFAVHFNRLFLLYCAALGLSIFALIGLLVRMPRQDVAQWYARDTPVRFPAWLLMILAAMFLALWLAEILGALVTAAEPASLKGTGLLSNPVHALDLSVTLPTIGLSGYWLLRRRPWGFVLAPMTLTFAVVTDVAIVAIIVASRAQGLAGELAVAAGIGGAAVVTFFALVLVLRGISRRPAGAQPESPIAGQDG